MAFWTNFSRARAAVSLFMIGFVSVVVVGCASTPEPPKDDGGFNAPSGSGSGSAGRPFRGGGRGSSAGATDDANGEEPPENIDIEGLQRELRLTRPAEVLGYQEATFNTCTVGFGYSSSRRCRRATMAVINFRLQCRDSEGTISNALGAADLRPIAGQGVRWTSSGQDGIATTDGEGYGTVRAVFAKSPKAGWLRLAVGIQFLNMRAGEITRVVTPRPWCHAP